VDPHILSAIGLLVDDKEPEVMSADAQAEFMKGCEIPRIPRHEREALGYRVEKMQRVMLARATQCSRRYQPVGTQRG
jgi:hypothetical protein